ncbi:O-methylsterigmatocystin oxidoreductase [Termitomyces sp. T112]|nr:O-methylsterigmatocystin oxidoreductase [Termitomyces sp. T112]
MISASSINSIDVLCVFLAIFIVGKILHRRQPQHGPLPPGPKGYPLIGNILDMPSKQEWATFGKWGEQYGDICSVTVLGQTIVILNSVKIAIEILEKKGSIYSDRPVLQMAGNLIGWRKGLGLMSYGDRFRRFRRLFHDIIGSKTSIQQFYYIEHVETHQFLRRVLANPVDLAHHIRHTAGAIITRITYGYQVKENGDPYVELADRVMSQFSDSATPGHYMVDILPQLRHVPAWFPGAGFKRKAKEWADTLLRAVEQPFDFVKHEMATGIAPVSFVSNLLAHQDVDGEKESDIKWSAVSLYVGGADTTVSAIYSFFLAMALNPDVMRKAQAEIDSVTGGDRLPTLEDRQNLPYIDALTKEVFRWNIVAPLGLPHRLIEDDVHDGFFIPKGATVIVNIQRILHDPEVYANPHSFYPERFIAIGDRSAEPDPRAVSFGFGRRICPGLHLADASIFISCAMSLAVFDITKYIENGTVIEPVHENTDGTVSHPKPYKCSIKPRSQKSVSLIEAEDD